MSSVHSFYSVFLIIAVTCNSLKTEDTDEGKSSAVDINQAPWVVSVLVKLEDESSVRCQGSILSRNFVLTAAHCLKRVDFESSVGVRWGSNRWDSDGKLSKVLEYALHPKFDPTTLEYDVAIVKLSWPLWTSRIYPWDKVLLTNKSVSAGDVLQMISWESSDKLSTRLVTLVEDEFCGTDIESSEATFCVSSNSQNDIRGLMEASAENYAWEFAQENAERGKGAGGGLGGGSLMRMGQQVGVASAIRTCAFLKRSQPCLVHTRVDRIRDFIDEITDGEAVWA